MPSGRLSGGLPGAAGALAARRGGGAGMAVVDERWHAAPVRPAVSTVPAAFDRQPPQDLAAEQSVLCGMLMSKDAVLDQAAELRRFPTRELLLRLSRQESTWL